jgi:hypothetical protein
LQVQKFGGIILKKLDADHTAIGSALPNQC